LLQGRLMGNITRAMRGVPEHIVLRQVGHLSKADRAYGEGVAKRLGVDVSLATA
jgi:catalase